MTLEVGARQGRRPSSAARSARPAPPSAKNRVTAAKDADEFVLALEEASRGIQDPVAKLRYIAALSPVPAGRPLRAGRPFSGLATCCTGC